MTVSEVVGIGQKSTQKYHIACCNVQIGAIIACVSVQFVIYALFVRTLQWKDEENELLWIRYSIIVAKSCMHWATSWGYRIRRCA